MMPTWVLLPASLAAKRRKTTNSAAAPAPAIARPTTRTIVSAR